MSKNKATKIVTVTGDVTIDWNIARKRKTDSASLDWNPEDVTKACYQYGGADILAELMSALAHEIGNVDVRKITLPKAKITPYDVRFAHSYAMWAPFKKDAQSEKKVWRVQEFLGLNPAHKEDTLTNNGNIVSDDVNNPDLVVLSDANLGFREHPEYWPKGLSIKKAHPWILVNTAKPVAQGPLWDNLLANHCDRVIAVMTAKDLRSEQIQISRHLSWESTAQDVVWELTYNPSINRLTQCAFTVVSFGTTGVMLCRKNAGGAPAATLFFDPNALEDEWGRQYKGAIIGYTSCLVAGIARQILLNLEQPDIARGIQKGIQAMRWLQIEGYGPVDNASKSIQLTFPAADIAGELTKDKPELASVMIHASMQKEKVRLPAAELNIQHPIWTILQEKHPGSLENAAREIVQKGLESALPDVPIARFGDLQTIDRREIEALQSISNLIREYIGHYQKTPLSMAVFGPPGSGKSFSVREVAESVAHGEIVPLTFNLSQFIGPDDLYDALHQVRDKVLTGKIPLVFWDEFDTSLQQQELGWLRYFLAPMQDGEFQEGQITHTIGRSIFVFAGGTTHSIGKFTSKLDSDKQKALKLPDFVSRLKGFLNILGPDPLKNDNDKTSSSDPYFVIRRAILLRSIIERKEPKLLQNIGAQKIMTIDSGVLRAFLNVRRYKHGARSIEAIIKMSQLSGKSSFERSCLPSESQLDLHVNGREFTAIMNQLELNENNIEIMARSFHENYCVYLRKQRYVWGPENSAVKHTHSSLVDYDKLPENEKKQNRNNVRDIPIKMSKVGYIMVTNRNNEPMVNFQENEIEKLAEIEHERWMEQKLADDWKWAARTDKANKLHQDLVEWEKLSDKIKENDRVMIRAIPQIIATAGYIMFKLD